MTDVERALWQHLRAYRLEGLKFKRQQPIGSYIVDFVCYEHRLIVELDGGQHSWQQSYDSKRDAYLKKEGFVVLRFWNHDVLGNMAGILTAIVSAAMPASPLPNPLPQAGEGTAGVSL